MNLKKFSFQIGSFRSDQYKIYNEENILKTEINGNLQTNQIKSNNWNEFWKVIDEIDAWRWGKDYFNRDMLDGTQWELVIDRKGKRRRRIFGSNDYPPNFKLLIDAINKLANTDIEHDEEE